MAETKQVRKIEVIVTGNGADQLKGLTTEVGKLNQNFKKTSDAMGTFSGLFQTFMGVIATNRLFEMSDNIQNLESRLRILHGTTEEASAVFTKLQKAARETHSTVADLGTMYTRLGMATKGTGISNKDLLNLVTALRNSFRLSGSTMAEATATTVQLAQSFSQGTLRGQELRSVLQQNTVAAGLLREKYGADLFKKAEAGQIDSIEVMKMLLANQESINTSAKKLSLTFGDALALSLDKVSVKLYALVKQTGATNAFAESMDLLAENIGKVTIALAVLLGPAILGKLAAVFASLGATFAPIIAFLGALTAEIWLAIAALTAIGTAAAYLANNWDTFTARLELGTLKIKTAIAELGLEFKTLLNSAAAAFKVTVYGTDDLAKSKAAIASLKAQQTTIEKFLEAKKKIAEYQAAEEEGPSSKFTPMEKDLGKFYKLNKAYSQGAISLEQYAAALGKVKDLIKDESFQKGQKHLFELRAQKRETDITEVNRAFSSGLTTINDYNNAIDGLKLEKLNDELLQGKITLHDYNSEVQKLTEQFTFLGSIKVGAENYIKSIGSLGEQVAKATENAFRGLEEGMADFLQKGSMDWKKFGQDIMNEITRIYVRSQLIAPLAGGIAGLGSLGDLFTPNGTAGVAAPGNINAIGSQLMPFASGGVVNTPTLFNMSKTGLTGESGPEAIIPLRRGSDGSLGVQAGVGGSNVVVNITNNSGAEITQKESTGAGGERTLDILIESKMKSAISRGALDKQMGMAYGLSRKGV